MHAVPLQLAGRLEIRSMDRIAGFLNEEHVGRIATVDPEGYPQVIPMNFVYVDGVVYMHSHTRGEKLDNMRADPRSGFEVDRELEFLPSHFSSPTDASLADTLYVSVVIKGRSVIVDDPVEKARALNALMRKYQTEGRYEPLRPDMAVLDHVAVIRVNPVEIRGKYKIGQHMRREDRAELARKIYGRNSPTALETLRVMGFEPAPPPAGGGDGGLRMVDEPVW